MDSDKFIKIQPRKNKRDRIAQDNPWQPLVESLDQFSEDFIAIREQPPLNTREDF